MFAALLFLDKNAICFIPLGRNLARFRIPCGSFKAGTLPVCNTAATTDTLTSEVAKEMMAVHFWIVPGARNNRRAGVMMLVIRTQIARMRLE